MQVVLEVVLEIVLDFELNSESDWQPLKFVKEGRWKGYCGYVSMTWSEQE